MGANIFFSDEDNIFLQKNKTNKSFVFELFFFTHRKMVLFSGYTFIEIFIQMSSSDVSSPNDGLEKHKTTNWL